MRLKQLLAISDCAHASIGAMASVRLEEEEPVVSPGGCHTSVRIKQIERTPGGTERVLRSSCAPSLPLQTGRAQRDGRPAEAPIRCEA